MKREHEKNLPLLSNCDGFCRWFRIRSIGGLIMQVVEQPKLARTLWMHWIMVSSQLDLNYRHIFQETWRMRFLVSQWSPANSYMRYFFPAFSCFFLLAFSHLTIFFLPWISTTRCPHRGARWPFPQRPVVARLAPERGICACGVAKGGASSATCPCPRFYGTYSPLFRGDAQPGTTWTLVLMPMNCEESFQEDAPFRDMGAPIMSGVVLKINCSSNINVSFLAPIVIM